MAILTIVANLVIKAEKIDLVKKELLILAQETRKEEGCINYDLHQDNADPTRFMFYENWQTRELWQAHMQSAHIKAYRVATQGCVESVTLNEMTQFG